MVWFIRTIPSDLISDACEKFDSSIMDCFQKLLGSGLSSDSLIQASLGTKNGGLGLRATKSHSTAAYISSFLCLSLFWKHFSMQISRTINWNVALLCTTRLSLTLTSLHPHRAHPVNKFFTAKLICIASNHFFLHQMLFIKLDCLLVQCLMPMLGLYVSHSNKRNYLAWNGQFP